MRVSTDDQVEGHSLDAQRIEIERHCKRQGFVLIRQYADEGVSAHTENIARRPQLAALLEDARDGEFDVVVVHTLDRWARNVGVQREALQLLGTAGVGFASVTEDIDFTAPAGKLMLTMIGGVSEFFSDQLGVHVSKAQKHRAESGLPVGGVPFGYVVPEPGEVPLLEPERGAAVAEAFERGERRERGDSYAVIAASFNERQFVTTRGNPFTAYTIKDMLKTRFYVGVVLYNGAEYPGQHEALIDEAAFRRLQLRRPRRQPRSKRGGAVLRGLVRCNGCHRPVYPDRHHTGRVLYRERHMRECSTEGTSVDANRIDGLWGHKTRSSPLGSHFVSHR